MKIKTFLLSSLALVGMTAGCGSGESSDTAPLPAKDAQTRVDEATKGVESSNMTPEQKQAAADYLQKGAAGAQQMQKNAQGAPQ